MAKLLFLFSPVLFGGATLLLGETFQWIKELKHAGFKTTRILHGMRRK